MSDIKLSEHRFHKGKFISPWNDMGFYNDTNALVSKEITRIFMDWIDLR